MQQQDSRCIILRAAVIYKYIMLQLNDGASSFVPNNMHAASLAVAIFSP